MSLTRNRSMEVHDMGCKCERCNGPQYIISPKDRQAELREQAENLAILLALISIVGCFIIITLAVMRGMQP